MKSDAQPPLSRLRTWVAKTRSRLFGNPAPRAADGDPTRLHMLSRLVWLCFFSVAMVLGGNALLALPQIREGLWAFDDGEGDALRRQFIFVLAFLYWAFITWYVARLTLGRRFPYDSVGAARSTFVHGVAEWLPRLLSLVATVPLTLFLMGTGKHPGMALVLLGVSVLFVVFTWSRRRLFRSKSQGYYRYYCRLDVSSLSVLGAAGLVPLGMLMAIIASPIGFSRMIGAPALMLFAVGAWSLVGGMLLSYWPRTRGWITLGWFPLVLWVAFSSSNDNHPIDWHAGMWKAEAAAADVKDPRLSLKAHYEKWIQQHPSGEPVYMVASAGGASRASYWAGVTLGRLEDEARAANRRFGKNIFMMSGISGGSVGIAAFASALRTWPASPTKSPQCIRLAMDRFLGADVLSPVGAMLLYPDLMQRFVPAFEWSHDIDRSRGLEQAWVQDWKALVDAPPAGCPELRRKDMNQNVWSIALVKALPAVAGEPVVVFNTARLEDGRRVLQSNANFVLRDADDLLGEGFEARARLLALAAAVHNSARFPLVSPPGTVHTAKGNVWGHLGDGGYHEVTGAATLADVIEDLIAQGCLRRDTPAQKGQPLRLFAKPKCGCEPTPEPQTDESRACPAGSSESRVIAILLDNTPTGFPADWQRDLDGKPRNWALGERVEQTRLSTPEPIELMGPLRGLMTQSGEKSRSAERRLSALVGTDPDAVIELRLPRYRGVREPSMNWQLDRDSRREMMCAADLAGDTGRPILSVGNGDASCSGNQEGHLPREDRLPANLADEAFQGNLSRLRALILTPSPVPAPQAASAPQKAASS